MERKTFKVDDLKVKINEVLQTSTCTADVRQGEIYVLEDILHSTGNYRGFQFLGADEVPAGELPGINWGFDNDYEARFFNTDRTRVRYF